jgi:nitrate/nitrite-specific signal transduction histidine kinase
MGLFSGMSIRWKVLIPMSLIIIIMLFQIFLIINMNRMQQEDAVRVNLAGRQRMLSQKMTKETLNFIISQDSKHSQEQQKTIATLEKSLDALVSGGELEVSGRKVTIKASKNETIVLKLEEASKYWQQVKPLYQQAVTGQYNSKNFDVNQLNSISKELVANFDGLTGMYETSSSATIKGNMNMIYIGLAIYLLVIGATLVFLQKKVINPIVSLRDTAAKIADGDLS